MPEEESSTRTQNKGKLGAWLKEHMLEAIGVIAGVIVLFLVWKGKSSSSVVAPAASAPPTPPATGGSSGPGVSSTDLTALQTQMQNALDSVKATLGQSEQADVASLTAQLQANGVALQSAQTALQQQIQAAQQAQNTALANSLKQQSDALAAVQSSVSSSLAGSAAGQASIAQELTNLAAYTQTQGQQGMQNNQVAQKTAQDLQSRGFQVTLPGGLH